MIQLQQQLTAVQVRRGPVYRAVSSLGTQVSILSFTPCGGIARCGSSVTAGVADTRTARRQGAF